jgi:penicillin G amidase
MTRFSPLLVLLALWAGTPTPAFSADTMESLQKKARTALAKIEGEITIPGLKAPVEILRDRWGVPHIFARNQDDLFFAQGFVVAQDRLFQIDTWRRVGLGETAEVVGRRGLEGDRFARLIKFRGDMKAEWESYAPDARAIIAAFTRGINACIDHMGDRLPVEFQILGTRPKKWQPEDVLARMSGIIMSRNFRNEPERAALIAAVGVEKARRLLPTDPVRDFGPVPGFDLAGIDRSILAAYNAATAPVPFGKEGSNNWTVDGTLSASGKPMLAADPHRTLALPSLRYITHLNAPGWNVIGAGEPAIPGVALGHNDHVAWGLTIVTTDQADIYVEDTHPDDPTRYRAGDQWVKMKVVREKVRVRGEKEPVELELRFTRHGPVIHQDAKRHRAFALRWSGSEPGGAAYLGALSLDRVRSAKEFVQTTSRWHIPSLNLTHADVDGNIGWIAAGLVPVRKGWDGLLPVPGAGGKYEWQRFLSVKELPQIANPSRHWLATANHNILPPDYRGEISYEWSVPYRFERIRQRLTAKRSFTLEDFQSIQQDNTSLPGQRLSRLVRRISTEDAGLKPYVDLLARWDGVLTRETPAGPLYAVWTTELLTEFFRPQVPKELLSFMASRNNLPLLLSALEKPGRKWFGPRPSEARDQFLTKTFTAAVKKTKQLLGTDIKGWHWGKLHTATFLHPLSALGKPYAKAFDLAPVERPGDTVTPNAAGLDDHYHQISGASYRHVFDLADWDRGLATSTPGQSGQPGSPHYADLLPLWAEGKYFPLAFSRKKVEEVMKHRLLLKPAR